MLFNIASSFNTVRDYFTEFYNRRKFEWTKYNTPFTDPTVAYETLQDSDNSRHFFQHFAPDRTQLNQDDVNNYIQNLMNRNASRNRPFQFYAPFLSDKPTPENRLPVPGIELLPYYFHPGNVISPNPETSRPLLPDEIADAQESYLPGDIDFGPPIDNSLLTLIITKFPQYLRIVTQYCRPAGTTDATFRDFNKPQRKTDPPSQERLDRILPLIDHFMNITPYLPIHFVDTPACKLPLSTGTGYHNRHSYFRKAYSHFSHPETYKDKPSSKGYFFNASKHENRFTIHRIKDTGYPAKTFLPDDPTDEQLTTFLDEMKDFFLSYPTMLFTRNHISDRSKTLKVRPVYAVDELFLDIELMLTFPATVQARKHYVRTRNYSWLQPLYRPSRTRFLLFCYY
jgi:hypothetical protein